MVRPVPDMEVTTVLTCMCVEVGGGCECVSVCVGGGVSVCV